jgi:chemotaxis protein MotA
MDPATLGGIAVAFGSLLVMAFLEGANPMSLIIPAPMILVLGGAIGVGIASTTLPDAILAIKSLPKAFLFKGVKLGADIDRLVELAEVARKQGLLALEAQAAEVSDPYLKKALQNVADGMDADELRIMMEDEAASMDKTQRLAAKFFNSLGGFSPTVGIIGTVVSLTHVLENLSNPAGLGHSIAGAFVATLWGVMSANFIWLPIGGRLGRMADLQAERFSVLTEGVMAVQSGTQPRVLGEKLRAMVPESQLAKPAEKRTEKAARPAKAAKTAEATA